MNGKRLDTIVTLILAAALAAGACSSDSSDSSEQDSDTAIDGTDTSTDTLPGGRTFRLGGVAEAYDVGSPRQWTAALEPLGPSELTEAVVIPLDHHGIPWESFTGPDNRITNPPGPWLNAINDLKAMAQASGKPIALRLSPISRESDTLAPDAREQAGILVLNDSWRPDCYDPSADGNPTKWRDAYAGYVLWAIDQFDPQWIILARRLNLYEENCGSTAYNALAGYVAEAQRRVVALTGDRPTTIVGVDVEDLYGFPKKGGRCVVTTPAECFDERKALLSGLDADVLGLESYPATALTDGLDTLPADWLTRIVDARSDLGAAIIGTNLPPAMMDSQGGVCIRFLESSEALQAQWVDQVINAGATREMTLVVWATIVDLLDLTVVASCPCAASDPDGVAVCQHLDLLGSKADQIRLMVSGGLVGIDESERQGLTLWKQTLGVE